MLESVERTATICNRKGLHARAAAKFVKTCQAFQAEVWVTRADDAMPEERVIGTSILGLMMLAAEPGTTLKLEAQGPEAAELLETLVNLIERRFDEGE